MSEEAGENEKEEVEDDVTQEQNEDNVDTTVSIVEKVRHPLLGTGIVAPLSDQQEVNEVGSE